MLLKPYLWSQIASPCPKRPDHFYRIQDPHRFLYKNHVAGPDTVSQDTARGAWLASEHSAFPSNWESRFLDQFGKIYTAVTLAFRALNSQNHIMNYQGDILKQQLGECGEVADDSLKAGITSQLLTAICVRRYTLKCGYDAAFKVAATWSVIRRHSRLRS